MGPGGLEGPAVGPVEAMGLEGPAETVVVMALAVLEALSGLTLCVGAPAVVVVTTAVVVTVVVVVTVWLDAGGAWVAGLDGNGGPAGTVMAGWVVGRNTGWSMHQVVNDKSPDGRGSSRGKGFLGRLARALAKFSFISGLR